MREYLRTRWWAIVIGLACCAATAPAWGNGNHNGDGTIDLADYAAFPDCMAGPGGGLGSDCDVFDSDSDVDVDIVDFAEFQKVFGTTTTVVIETATVGNPGNPGELSGEGAGGYGPDRICGAVDYEYNIGKYEVTAGQYCAFLNAVAATDTYGLYNTNMDSSSYGCQITRNGTSGSYTYDFSGRPSGTEADWVDRPVSYVSWGDAARFANWLHNGQPTGVQDLTTTEDGSYYLNGAMSNVELLAVDREPDATWVIPSEDEWYKSAYHKNDGVTGNYFDYPTSNDAVPSNYLVDPDPGNNANFHQSDYTIGAPYWRTEVGEFENSDSPYGTFDQGGNVWEWNEAIPIGSCRGLRGGSFDDFDVFALHASLRYVGTNPSYEDNYLGFRVSEVTGAPSPDMVLVPAGEFEMGDSFGEGYEEELPVHYVYLDVYYIDTYQVTNQQYADYLNWADQGGLIHVSGGVVYQYGGTTYPYCNTYSIDTYSRIHWDEDTFTVTAGKEDHPMVEVSWYGAVAFCNWRSTMEGRTPCYDLATWMCDFDADGFRLPTEAEWEKAAGWDPDLAYHFRFGEHSDGCGWNCLDGQRANYFGSGDPFETWPYPWTTPVGFYNGELHYKVDFDWPGGATSYQTQDAQSYYGCRDMTGNVFEWCHDWYDSGYYSSSPYDNPTGPGSGTYRVLRGGVWVSSLPYLCRSAMRNWFRPDTSLYYLGFRCVVGTP
jgi:sulfatase modifying factor 1